MTTFGEIVEPCSRTAWEDWDEITVESEYTNLKWQRNLESPEDINTFLILEGKFISDCFNVQTRNLELINSIPEVNLMLFRSLVEDKYVCTIKNYDLLLSSEIVELLRQYLIVSNNVIALQTKSIPEYQTLDLTNEDCIIRIIATTKTKPADLNFPKLEQPNIISGVTAGVISLREHLDEQGMALVCYMGESHTDALEALLEKLNICSPKKTNSIINSNLYI